MLRAAARLHILRKRDSFCTHKRGLLTSTRSNTSIQEQGNRSKLSAALKRTREMYGGYHYADTRDGGESQEGAVEFSLEGEQYTRFRDRSHIPAWRRRDYHTVADRNSPSYQPPSPTPRSPRRERTPFDSASYRTTSPYHQPPPTSPTPSYLSLASEEPSTATEPPRKLLILDLNGTLLVRPKHGTAGTRSAHPRPYMPTFKAYLFHERTRVWLDTMIWSSAQPHNVGSMAERCFSPHENLLVAVWARDTLGLSSRDYQQKSQTVKDLRKPWAHLSELSHSAKTTLLLDDSPRKARLQPFNHLCVPEYSMKMKANDVAVKRAAMLERLKEGVRASIKQKRTGGPDGNEGGSVDKRIHKKLEKQVALLSSDTSQPLFDAPFASNESSKVADTTIHSDTKENIVAKADEGSKESAETELRIDETLLAVIGILNEARTQSNVASWVKSGGLWGPKGPPIVSSVPEQDTSATPPSSQHSVLLRHDDMDYKRERVGSLGNVENHTVADSMKTRLVAMEVPLIDDHDIKTSYIPGNDADTAVATSPDSSRPAVEITSLSDSLRLEQDVDDCTLPMWFENPSLLQFWVARGKGALAELDISLDDGIDSWKGIKN